MKYSTPFFNVVSWDTPRSFQTLTQDVRSEAQPSHTAVSHREHGSRCLTQSSSWTTLLASVICRVRWQQHKCLNQTPAYRGKPDPARQQLLHWALHLLAAPSKTWWRNSQVVQGPASSYNASLCPAQPGTTSGKGSSEHAFVVNKTKIHSENKTIIFKWPLPKKAPEHIRVSRSFNGQRRAGSHSPDAASQPAKCSWLPTSKPISGTTSDSPVPVPALLSVQCSPGLAELLLRYFSAGVSCLLIMLYL